MSDFHSILPSYSRSVASPSSRRLPSLPQHPQNLLYFNNKSIEKVTSETCNEWSKAPLSLFEMLYLLFLSATGIALGYLASKLTWPENFAPLMGLAVTLYLISTHRSVFVESTSGRIHLPASPRDVESFIPALSGQMGGGEEKMSEREDRWRAILREKRAGYLEGVYAFGGGEVGCAGEKGGAGEVWIIVEDVDA